MSKSLASKTLTSALWAFSSGYANIAIGFVGNLLLARTLLPEQFGVFALASALLVFVTMFTGFGSQEAIIQCRDERINGLVPTAFWISLIIGVLISIVGILMGLAMSAYYGATVGLLVISLSMLVPFTSVANAQSALLKRDMVYKPEALTRTVSVTFSFAIGVIAAVAGLGPWALMVRQGSEVIVYWFGMRRAGRYRFQLIFNMQAARWIWNFGWKQMFSQITEVALGRYDNLLIGTFIGSTELGFYNQAYRLGLLGQQFTQGAISPVLFSMFATMQHSASKLQYGFERVNFWIYRMMPLLGVLIFLIGERAVIFLYGEKWAIAGRYFESMFIFFIFLPVAGVLKSFLVGAGRINDVVKTKTIQLVFFMIGVSVGVLMDDIEFVIWIVNLNQVLAVFLMAYFARRLISINWKYLCITPSLAFILTIVFGQWISTAMSETLAGMILLIVVVSSLYTAILIVSDHRSLQHEFEIIWEASRG